MTDLPSSWSKDEICTSLHINRRTVDRLIRQGKVSYYTAGRSQRFLVEHVAQIVAALEVKPRPATVEPSYLGLTPQSAARRRRQQQVAS